MEGDLLPHGKALRIPFRHFERSALRIHGLQGDETGGRGHVVPQTDQSLTDDAGERRPHDRAIQPNLSEIQARL